MRSFFIFLFLVFFSIVNSFSQEFEIKGIILDATSKVPLEATTIHAESVNDSTLITYTIANQKGVFELKGNTKLKEVNVFFSFNGYRSLVKRVSLKPIVNLETIFLEEEVEELDGVVIIGERSPITIKKDTLEFNANSFKTRPDADVEDLLRKLPGVDINNDGAITINGKTVDKVLVGGKPFFGNDPKIALKNLTKEMVSKIQVLDTKTDLEEFTGKKSTSNNKTINIELQKDKNKGIYGRLFGGYGNNGRYQGTGIVNFFDNQKRLSVLGGANNLDMPGFSNNELSDMVSSYFGNSGDGLSESYDIGVNYVDNWGKGKDLSTNYFHTNESIDNQRKVERENILPDKRFFSTSDYNYHSDIKNRTGRAKLKFKIDSTTKLTVEPYYRYSNVESSAVDMSESAEANNQLVNSSMVQNSSRSNNSHFTNRISFLKRFRKKGSYFMFDFRNQNRENDAENYRESEYNIFGDNPTTTSQNEQINNLYSLSNWRVETEFRRSIAKNTYLNFNYVISTTKEETQKDVFDFNQNNNQFELFDEELSANFRIYRRTSRPLIRLNYEGDKLYASVTTSNLNVKLENQDILHDGNFEKTFSDINVNGRVKYELQKGQNISMRYNVRSGIPSINQLQIVPNVNNPLNVVVGNPNLDRAITKGTSVEYNNYDFKNKSSFYFSGDYNTTDNQVVGISTTDDNLLRKTTFTNVDGNTSASARTHFHKTMKKDSVTIRYGIGSGGSYRKFYNFTNGVKFSTNTLSFSPGVSFSYNYKELLDLESRYSLGLNNNSYSIETFDSENFMTHWASLRSTTYWPKNIILANDIRYSYNPSIAPGFEKGSLYWNVSMSLKMMQDNGILKLKVYDLLNEQINTRRVVAGDYIQSTRSLVLNQYFILGFTYKLNTLAANKHKKLKSNRRG